MRLHVAYESDGHIVALVEPSDEGRIAVRPLPGDGREVAELEVPDDYAELPLSALRHRLRVATGPQGPALVERPDS
ncbi:hypothetical protein ACIQNU_38870 [Streptomyces sp. NPDC091292]|uniref:hypothetical protein n=1 Tax=Streptomyces sp. NPDC091292 TaxID=3365991 RepID=UPI00380FCF92